MGIFISKAFPFYTMLHIYYKYVNVLCLNSPFIITSIHIIFIVTKTLFSIILKSCMDRCFHISYMFVFICSTLNISESVLWNICTTLCSCWLWICLGMHHVYSKSDSVYSFGVITLVLYKYGMITSSPVIHSSDTPSYIMYLYLCLYVYEREKYFIISYINKHRKALRVSASATATITLKKIIYKIIFKKKMHKIAKCVNFS